MTRRTHRSIASVVALGAALALTACAPSTGGDDAKGGGGDTTLTVWSWRVEDKAAYDTIFAAYEKAHPGVNVDFKAFKATEYNKILATGLAGSDGPDVPQVRSYGQLQTTVASDTLVPLDGKVDLSGWDENVVASAKGKEDGKIYSVPLARQTTVMFFNQDAFDKAGLKAPTTWDEFMAANTKLAADGLTPIAVGAKDDWTLPMRARGPRGSALRWQGVPEPGRHGRQGLHRPRLGRLGEGRQGPREVHAQERHRGRR